MRCWRGVLVAAGLIVTACAGSDRPDSAACTAPTAEDLDPASGVHVLRPDDAVFADLTPTSGPHLGVTAPTGVVRTTVAGAAQVALLEQGGAVISVRSDRTDLIPAAAELVVDRVVLHPVDDLPDPLVVTVWRSRITCSSVDDDYVAWFIADRTRAPEHSS